MENEPVRRPRAHVALAVVTALLGFMLATQYQAREGLKSRLAGEREEDLAQILSNLATSSDQIQDEIVELRVRLQTARGSAQQEQVLLDAARAQLNSLRILLGLVAAHGPGIVTTVGDPSGTVGPEVLLDLVQELRDAGAEAIDVNGVRVVGSTSFAGEPGALTVSGAKISSPYQITAIGAADTLAEALRIPGGVVDSVNSRQGATIVIQPRPDVRIASLRPAPRFTYASPA
jgi:uncharacterized protein YlxW (UPF0749 family)